MIRDRERRRRSTHGWRLKAEEEARIVEEARLKLEEDNLRIKSEDEAQLVEEARLKDEH